MLPGEIETLRSENADLREKLDSMQAQLMQAQKLGSIGVLASSITHEFNNILMTVINYSKMGLRHRDNDTREKAFNKILDAGQRAAKITTGMLSYARAKGDRRDPLSLVQVVQDVLVLVEKDLQKHRITLDTRFQDDPYAEVNSGQVQQVLLNLIINARQAMAKGGTLTIIVRTNAQDGMGEVAVRDTGTGIPAAKLPHIFDPFFSTKKADEQGQGGTGLGLALCKDIIEAHKGRIRVESAEGQGTCFTLRFPLVEKPALLAG
ncbi:MAG: HAMP domain-containing histidine kinase [Planctomycetaceae bacterium]|nr:HAMP domain-containing histidine kinase [Planctomycetaceae bacterium]